MRLTPFGVKFRTSSYPSVLTFVFVDQKHSSFERLQLFWLKSEKIIF